jgi:hypothetical protein
LSFTFAVLGVSVFPLGIQPSLLTTLGGSILFQDLAHAKVTAGSPAVLGLLASWKIFKWLDNMAIGTGFHSLSLCTSIVDNEIHVK